MKKLLFLLTGNEKNNEIHMKKNLLLSISILCCHFVFGQDSIYIKQSRARPWLTNKVVTGQVTEIKGNVIKYIKAESADGRISTLYAGMVDHIVYENGMVERFTAVRERMPKPIPEHKLQEINEFKDLPSNLLSTGIWVLVSRLPIPGGSGDYTPLVATYLNYEKIFLQERLGIGLIPFIGLNRKNYGAAIQAKFYGKNTGRTRVGVGPMYILNVQEWEQQYYTADNFSSIKRKEDALISTLAFNFSLLSHIDRKVFVNFDCALGGTIGIKLYDKNLPPNWQKSGTDTKGLLALKLGVGYRF